MGTGLEGIAAKDEDESTRCAVNQILKSVVREICTLRSVGVGASIWYPFYPAGGAVRLPPIPISPPLR